MKSSKWIFVLLALLVPLAFAGEGTRTTPSILPNEFAGWMMSGSRQASKDAGAADPINATLLKEYGFTDFDSVNAQLFDRHACRM